MRQIIRCASPVIVGFEMVGVKKFYVLQVMFGWFTTKVNYAEGACREKKAKKLGENELNEYFSNC